MAPDDRRDDGPVREGDAAEADGGAGAGTGAGGVNEAVVEAFESELADARRQADANWDRYLRAEADLDNLRKRGERLRDDALARQRRELLLRFLDVADNLERALSFGDADPAALLAGVEATYRELGRLLSREGVARIEAMEAPFDPAFHEAVGALSVPGLDEERVVSVEQPGYTLDGDLLRPARVMVGRPVSDEG
jgi:molecular chaperone GrpE